MQNSKSIWDKLGATYSGLESVGLDWEPCLYPIETTLPNGKKLIESDYKIVRNSKTMQAIAACSGTWQPLGNREFEAIAKTGIEAVGGTLEKGGYLHGAKNPVRTGDRTVFFVSGELPDLGFAIHGDELEVYSSRLFFYNHHQPGRGLGCKLICVRKICSNGMIAKTTKLGVAIRHTQSGVERYRQSQQNVSVFTKAIASYKEVSEALATQQVSDEEAFDFFVEIEGDKKKGKAEQPLPVKIMHEIYQGLAVGLLDDRGVDLSLTDYTNHTAYGVLQAATGYYSNLRPSSSLESFLKSSVLTDGSSRSELLLGSLVRAYRPKMKVAQTQTVAAW